MLEVRKLFDYNPDTGWLIWKQREIKGKEDKIFNTRNSGKRAGSDARGGYRVVRIHLRLYSEHHIIWLWMSGKLPKDHIDHINGIPNDNRWYNLREATQSENMQNYVTANKFMGATWYEEKQKWRGRIRVDGKEKHLGSPELAHAAYLTAKAKYHTFQPVPRTIG